MSNYEVVQQFLEGLDAKGERVTETNLAEAGLTKEQLLAGTPLGWDELT